MIWVYSKMVCVDEWGIIKIIISGMMEQTLAKMSRLPRKQLSQLGNAIDVRHQRNEGGRFSQPKGSINRIKINKNKLPNDFFPKRDCSQRRPIRGPYQQEITEPILTRKAESQRIHYTPEKTSFFGFFQDRETQNCMHIYGGTKLYNRKFETREETKRDLYQLETARKLNTAAKHIKSDVLELFPPTHTNQLNQFLNSKTQFMRGSNRRDMGPRQRQMVALQDPQKLFNVKEQKIRSSPHIQEPAIHSLNTSLNQNKGQEMTITFYNAKSSCFPPIVRGGN